MSRGPGRWQRLILETLERYDVVSIRNLVEDHVTLRPTRAELVAARRAAYRLDDADKLRVIYPWFCGACETVLRCLDDGRHYHYRSCGPWPTVTLAVTRDATVLHPSLIGTPAATAIPSRLSVAFQDGGREGNTYRGPAARAVIAGELVAS